jgi:hypothetical protein
MRRNKTCRTWDATREKDEDVHKHTYKPVGNEEIRNIIYEGLDKKLKKFCCVHFE